MEQSLKSVLVGNSSGDIHLHIAFMPTNCRAMEIPGQHCDECDHFSIIYLLK